MSTTHPQTPVSFFLLIIECGVQWWKEYGWHQTLMEHIPLARNYYKLITFSKVFGSHSSKRGNFTVPNEATSSVIIPSLQIDIRLSRTPNLSPRTWASNRWAALSFECSEAETNSVVEAPYLRVMFRGKTYSIKVINGTKLQRHIESVQ